MSEHAGYCQNQSPLFKLRSKKRLAQLLRVSVDDLQKLSTTGSYKLWITKPKYPGATHPSLAHKPRAIQEPKGRLAQAQKRIANLLARISLPDYLHSARKGRSYRTNALAHRGPHPAFRIDVEKFYESARNKHVFRFFRDELECSPDVSHILTSIACYETKLPTGSALSPILSFFAYRRMFDEINQLARAVDATMTVYVDDIVVSGAGATGHLIPLIKAVLKKYGLRGHKIVQWRRGDTKVITGMAIRDGQLRIPNKRWRKIRGLLSEYQRTDSHEDKAMYKSALLGQLREAGGLHAGFVDLARQLERDLTEPNQSNVTALDGAPALGLAPESEEHESLKAE